ncbi:MAG TPA: hypothetical protein VFY06_07280 [Verrucomicrobiae bacterium]|nr:hypothetical protein [Verrucomicrobiae bacterium]
METKPHSKTSATDESAKNLMCWRTATSPQCLRVETTSEIHLFVYGYFQHAKFSRQNGKEIVQIQFQDRIIVAKGKGLESLCDALERLAVERIKVCPEKYQAIARNEGVIEVIEIKKINERETNSNE